MQSDTVKVTLEPTAHLRCPFFANDPHAQRFWDELWAARLRIFGRLFPFVGESIRALAGLPRDAVIGGDDHATNVAYRAAHDEYAKGYRSERPEVRAIHDRQNSAWEALAGLPALGSITDWRAAAAAAGIPAADFEQHDFEMIADCILAWAQARRANRSSFEEPAQKPLTELHQAAYDLICEESKRGRGITGKAICNRLGIDSESNFTAHYVPELKRHGILNRRGLGYYHPDFYTPGPTLGGKR